MKTFIFLALVAFGSAAIGDSPKPRWKRQGGTPVRRSCASIQAPTVPGARVVSIKSAERRNFTMPTFGGPGGAPGAGAGAVQPLSFCDVNVTLTHGDAGDRVRVEVWMPLDGWNGRFQGTGGGGFIAGTFGQAMAPAVAGGFAAASTDAGLQPSFDGTGIFGNLTTSPLASNGTISSSNQLFTNFASLSVHEMAIVGKAMVNAFYGAPPKFSYWNGCSTGGRQGYQEAQMFPTDFNGILAIAPAINWAKFVTAGLWPNVVMAEEGEVPTQCVFNAFISATIAACDMLDGGRDRLLADPGSCAFNPQSMVGQMVNCNGTVTALTARQATIYTRILDGARAPDGTFLWFSLLPGASLSTLATSTPFSLSATWVSDFVLSGNGGSGAAAAVDLTRLTSQQFADIFTTSQQRFGPIIGTENPDLSAFRAAGGKLLTWHGLADQLIMPNGTFDYLRRVSQAIGTNGGAAGPDSVADFYRVFTAPGVMHCAGGAGPEPTAALDALVAWVEKGQAPETLAASRRFANGTSVSRNLCRFPRTLMFKGSGDINSAESWSCMDATAQEVVPGTLIGNAPTIVGGANIEGDANSNAVQATADSGAVTGPTWSLVAVVISVGLLWFGS